jgi:hypothetical protein
LGCWRDTEGVASMTEQQARKHASEFNKWLKLSVNILGGGLMAIWIAYLLVDHSVISSMQSIGQVSGLVR